MKVEVRLFATLAAFLPPGTEGGVALVDAPEGSTVADLTRGLGIPDELPRILLVNGWDAEPEQRLAPNDVVTLFPPLAGGSR
ncbi:MAG: MoaD/ThiS family protein [Candidatus Rokubacteria bacterium]|nr:MoaD/ThiS family protein [Candidatus Rokubacteria bacterium]